jgi:hypothetical protein
MRGIGLLGLFALLPALSCAGGAAPRVYLQKPLNLVRLACPIDGRADLSGQTVYAEPDRNETAFVEVPGGVEIGVRVDVIAEATDYGSAYSRVSLRAPADGAGLRIEGWMYFPLALVTTRRLEVVPDAVWIEAGARVRARVFPDGVLRVKAYDGEFHDVVADAPCGALQVGMKHVGPLPPPAGATRAHAAGEILHLYASPTGKPIELRPENCNSELYITETRGAFRFIEYGYGLRVRGWVPTRDLAPGNGHDCDDRHGSVRDSFDIDPPEGLRAVKLGREAPLFARPDADARVVGDASSGAAILVQDLGRGWLRVFPEGFEVMPFRDYDKGWLPAGLGLWMRAADLPSAQ